MNYFVEQRSRVSFKVWEPMAKTFKDTGMSRVGERE